MTDTGSGYVDLTPDQHRRALAARLARGILDTDDTKPDELDVRYLADWIMYGPAAANKEPGERPDWINPPRKFGEPR